MIHGLSVTQNMRRIHSLKSATEVMAVVKARNISQLKYDYNLAQDEGS